MNSSKKLTSEEILETYGIKWTESADKTLSKTLYRVTGFEFDKNAVIHWFMGMNTPIADRGVAVTDIWNRAARSLFRYVQFSGWLKNKQAKISFRPHKRHPVQDQIAEIEHWSESVFPVETNYGISTVIPIIDRSGKDSRYHFVFHEQNRRTVVKIACPLASNRYETANEYEDLFDAVYYAKDNLYADANTYIKRERIEDDFFYNLERKREEDLGNAPRETGNEMPEPEHPDEDPDEEDEEDEEEDDEEEDDDRDEHEEEDHQDWV